MTLEDLKEEYIKSIDADNSDDHEQLINEIYEADDLGEFIRVVGAWANDKDNVGVGILILRRIIRD